MMRMIALLLMAGVAVSAWSSSLVVQRNGQVVGTVRTEAGFPLLLDSRNGVVTVRCDPHPQRTSECYDPLDFSSHAPTITLLATGATPPIRPDGTYAPGTRITLSAPALPVYFEICERQFLRVPNYGTGIEWTGWHTRATAALPIQVTLSRSLTRFDFNLRCYGPTGARSSNRFMFITGS